MGNRNLEIIMDDAQDALREYAAKAVIQGYRDGIKLGYDEGSKDELCDAFVEVWNDRAELLRKLGEQPTVTYAAVEL